MITPFNLAGIADPIVKREFENLYAQLQKLPTLQMDFEGSGSPERTVKAPLGARYRRRDINNDGYLYIKESGGSTEADMTNDGWVVK